MHFFRTILLATGFVAWFCQSSAAQKPGLDSLKKKKEQLVIQFLNIQPGDRIVDIGTGSGYSLIPIANAYPDIKITAEDIDSNTCNTALLTKRILQSGGPANIGNITIQIGTEKGTNLPVRSFTRAFVFDVIHEMTWKKEMLADIKRILRDSGVVYIEEVLVHKKIKKDRGCNYPFLTEPELKVILQDNGYTIVREIITADSGKNRYLKLFECKPQRE